MKSSSFTVIVGLLIFVAGCTSSSITQTARNQALISTSAAPICGTSGALQVANEMAAVATIRQGYERFVIVGLGAENNTSVVRTGPTYSTTTGTFNTFGNTTIGHADTTYGGSTTLISGSNDAQMQVVMLNPGDPGFDQGLDARTTLGADWQKIVEEGKPNCF